MFSFKNWLQKENLQGPGGGPEPNPESQEKLAKDMNHRGIGAFPTYGDNPIAKARTATADYVDPRFGRKFMTKDKTSKNKKPHCLKIN